MLSLMSQLKNNHVDQLLQVSRGVEQNGAIGCPFVVIVLCFVVVVVVFNIIPILQSA